MGLRHLQQKWERFKTVLRDENFASVLKYHYSNFFRIQASRLGDSAILTRKLRPHTNGRLLPARNWVQTSLKSIFKDVIAAITHIFIQKLSSRT